VKASEVTTLAATNYGVAFVAAIDVSGSMQGAPLNAVRAGLGKFVSEAGAQDKLAVMTIANEGRWDVNWDSPRENAKNSLDRLATRGTRTLLWDSLLDAVAHFPDTPLSRRLMVVSDGHDEGSKHTEQQVIDAARANNVVIESIGITRSAPKYLLGLEKLATETGGNFRQAKDTNQLQEFVGSGIQQVKATPVVSFRLQDLPGDGKDHRLQVIWKRGDADVRAEVTALIPLVTGQSKKVRWLWLAGLAGAVLLAIIAIVFMRSNRPKPTEPALVTTGPVSSQNVPVAPRSVPPSPIPARPMGARTSEDGARFVGAVSREPAPSPAPSPARSKTKIGVRFPTPAKGKPAAWLVCEEGYSPGATFAVDEAEYWIGALENNHLRLANDRTVSANHACLVFDHDVLGIFDNGSTNGTRVNGELVSTTRTLLRPGDRIGVGRSIFVLKATNPEVAGA
jgi:hypothetical protein